MSKYFTKCIDYILKTEITLPPDFALRVRAASFVNVHGGERKAEEGKPNIKFSVCYSCTWDRLIIDARCITKIIHCRPPTAIEKYLQEIGRAGRSGNKCIALLYFTNNDIAKNKAACRHAQRK